VTRSTPLNRGLPRPPCGPMRTVLDLQARGMHSTHVDPSTPSNTTLLLPGSAFRAPPMAMARSAKAVA
jgi:hypothetical protein